MHQVTSNISHQRNSGTVTQLEFCLLSPENSVSVKAWGGLRDPGSVSGKEPLNRILMTNCQSLNLEKSWYGFTLRTTELMFSFSNSFPSQQPMLLAGRREDDGSAQLTVMLHTMTRCCTARHRLYPGPATLTKAGVKTAQIYIIHELA